MMGKKAQITVFIIVGIIVLVGVGLYLGLRSETVRERLGVGVELTLEEVPVEFSAVKPFVEGCIREVAEEGLRVMGERGGFVDPSGAGYKAGTEPTEGGAVEMSPGSDYVVPYWYYMASPNNCQGGCAFMKVPEEALRLKKNTETPSIQEQLELYINNNLDVCLADFKILKDKGFSVNKLGRPAAEVRIRDEEVSIRVNYPLEFSKVSTRKISDFIVRHNINLNKIYDLAKELVDLQAEYRYLERDLLNLLVGFSGVDATKLPPMHETILQFGGGIRWPVEKVKRDVVGILSFYIPILKVTNTLNYQPIYTESPLVGPLYNSGMTIPIENDYSDLEVRFSYYDWWPIYFQINCKGGVCRAESVSSNIMALIGMQIYSTVYDISFPVLVEIRDKFAFDNRGYSFYFFMESNVRNNAVMEAEYVAAPVVSSEASMFCDIDKRFSGDITVGVYDADDYEIDNAEVFYTWGDENCYIGKTENGALTAKFPTPIGGIITVIKDGYLSKSMHYDAELDKDDSLRFNLEPILIRKFVVKKKLIEKVPVASGVMIWKPTMRVVDLDENETAMVVLEKTGETTEEMFQSAAVYLGNQTEPSEIKVGAGEFKVNIDLLLDRGIVIPERDVGPWYDKETIPEVKLNAPYPSGGLGINYTFKDSDLKNSDTIIVFYALSYNLYDVPEQDRRIEDLEKVFDLEEASRVHGYRAVPGFE